MTVDRGRVRFPLLLSPLLAMFVVLALAGSALATSGQSAPQAAGSTDARSNDPKVVIIVGPTGSLTASFLREAEAAARIARRHSDNVHTIYTPQATWAAVRPALQGADIVIYLGHGNGWPSPYRNSLFRPTQNGLGLNPVAGGSNHTHRYYGEKYLARDVKLAPGAIVLLHHLCYAAGNSEPGLAEGPANFARQRIENYGAGWLAAGASAVVAEAYLGPAFYVRALFESKKSVEKVWRSSPTFKGNVESWASGRTEGATAFMDPDLRRGMYGRSLVMLGERPSGPNSEEPSEPEAAFEPDELVPEPPPPLAGASLEAPVISAPIVSDTTVELTLPLSLPGDAWIPEGVVLDATWLPLPPEDPDEDLDDPEHPIDGPQDPADQDPPESDSELQVTMLTGLATTLGEDATSLEALLDTPTLPGSYELVFTLRAEDDELLTDQPEELTLTTNVDVARPLSVAYGLPPELDAVARSELNIQVSVSNTGIIEWQQIEEDVLDARGPDPFALIPAEQAKLVGRILRVEAGSAASAPTDEPVAISEISVAPGETLSLDVVLEAPQFSGEYLLVFDVETPSYGPLAERGSQPATLLLHVAPAPALLAVPAAN
ncbi:hypothetical protein BH24CHL6_BH24CHL6_12010 [soil metagenome]